MNANESGLKPLGRAVLVRMMELEELKTEKIFVPQHVREKSSVMEQRAEVIAVGDSAWEDEKAPRCAVGDRVVVTKMAGYVIIGPRDGKVYRLVNDRDIFCLIEAAEAQEAREAA